MLYQGIKLESPGTYVIIVILNTVVGCHLSKLTERYICRGNTYSDLHPEK